MKVAFVGFAGTAWHIVETLPKSTEIWTVNHGHKFGFRIDRLFEMHTKKQLEDKNFYVKELRDRYLKFLNTKHDFPIYMQSVGYPAAVKYPMEDALKLAGGKRFRSSFAYMAAFAILEKVDKVDVYGFEMSYYEAEYRFQRPNALYWIGRMEGAGIEVNSRELMPDRLLYGYEQTQMISRHTLEIYLKRYEKQYTKFLSKTNYWKGIFKERTMNGGDEMEAAQAVQTYEYSAAGAKTAVKVMNDLIAKCDLEE